MNEDMPEDCRKAYHYFVNTVPIELWRTARIFEEGLRPVKSEGLEGAVEVLHQLLTSKGDNGN